jgi:DNA-binding transcriptional LysR family regulator
VPHLSTAVALVASGAGLTMLPESALAGEVGKHVVAVPLVKPALTRSVGLLHRRDRVLSPAAQSLMAEIRATLVDAPSRRMGRAART